MKALAIHYIDNKTKHEFHLPLAVFKQPTNDKEYRYLEGILDKSINKIRDDETYPLALAMQIIGNNLEHYDTKNFPVIGKSNRY